MNKRLHNCLTDAFSVGQHYHGLRAAFDNAASEAAVGCYKRRCPAYDRNFTAIGNAVKLIIDFCEGFADCSGNGVQNTLLAEKTADDYYNPAP